MGAAPRQFMHRTHLPRWQNPLSGSNASVLALLANGRETQSRGMHSAESLYELLMV